MKHLMQTIINGFGLALSLSLTSCEKDNLATPNQAGSARSGAVDDVISPNIPQIYRLSKHGNATLTYTENGRLLNVLTPVRSSEPIQTDYSYSSGSIRAFSHQGKITLRDETFYINASGRCYESAEKITVVNNNVPLHYLREWAYNYDTKGRLRSYQNKNSCVGGFGYDYNADGDMIGATESSSIAATIFAYDKPTNDPMLDDKCPMNIIGVNEHDAYLRIFGKPGKHLVKLVSSPTSGSDLYFTYLLNADDYVTKRIEYSGLSGVSPKTTLYEYLSTDITLQL